MLDNTMYHSKPITPPPPSTTDHDSPDPGLARVAPSPPTISRKAAHTTSSDQNTESDIDFRPPQNLFKSIDPSQDSSSDPHSQASDVELPFLPERPASDTILTTRINLRPRHTRSFDDTSSIYASGADIAHWVPTVSMERMEGALLATTIPPRPASAPLTPDVTENSELVQTPPPPPPSSPRHIPCTPPSMDRHGFEEFSESSIQAAPRIPDGV